MFNFFLPGLSEHYGILSRLRVGTKFDIFKVLALSSLAVFFEAWGIAMVLPIISFINSGRDTVKFANASKVGGYIVEVFSATNLPLNLLTLCSVVILMISIRQVLNYLQTLQIDLIKLRVGRNLSIRCFQSILGSKAENIGSYESGQFASLVQHECQAASSILRIYARIWGLLLTFGIYISIMLVMAPVASIGAIVLIGGIIMSMEGFINITRRLAGRRIDVRANFISFLNERFRSWRLIKMSNALAFESTRALEHAQRDFDTEYAVSRIGGILQMILTPIVMFVALFGLYFTIEYLSVDVEKVAMFMVILLRLVPTGQSLSGQRNLIASYDPSLRLIEKTLLQSKTAKEKVEEGRDIHNLNKGIVFKNVFFKYPGEKTLVLKNINTTIPAGKMTAIIGHSGAGKSTLIDLILRIYDPSEGQIYYDEILLDEFSLASLRQKISCVTQETFVMNDSVAENIKYLKRDATMEQIQEAVNHAHAREFIENLPEGFDTFLGENGTRLSGGEKQRITLARAFLSGAKIFILDEPTSALDSEAEAKIQEVIEEFVKKMGLTVIVIAHRLSTIKNADFILHLSKGEVIQQGSPKDVLNNMSEIAEVAHLI